MYATVQDCIARRGDAEIRLLADEKGGDPPAYGLLEAALQDASDEIDLYVGKRHALPLDPVPRALARLCVEIGIYRRCSDAGLLTEERTARHDGAIRVLQDIAAGKASLGAADPDPPAAATAPAAAFDARPRELDRESLRGLV